VKLKKEWCLTKNIRCTSKNCLYY